MVALGGRILKTTHCVRRVHPDRFPEGGAVLLRRSVPHAVRHTACCALHTALLLIDWGLHKTWKEKYPLVLLRQALRTRVALLGALGRHRGLGQKLVGHHDAAGDVEGVLEKNRKSVCTVVVHPNRLCFFWVCFPDNHSVIKHACLANTCCNSVQRLGRCGQEGPGSAGVCIHGQNPTISQKKNAPKGWGNAGQGFEDEVGGREEQTRHHKLVANS